MIMWIMKLTTHYRLDITHSYNTKVRTAQQIEGQNFVQTLYAARTTPIPSWSFLSSSIKFDRDISRAHCSNISVIKDEYWIEQRLWLGAVKQGPVWRWLTGGTVDRGLATSVGNESHLALHDRSFQFHSHDGSQRLAFFCQHGRSAAIWKCRLDSLNETCYTIWLWTIKLHSVSQIIQITF